MGDAERITSRDNARLKHARQVRDGKVPGSIFIEGQRLCSEAVSSGVEIETVFATDRFIESPSFDHVQNDQQSVFVVSESLLGSIADTKTPQGIVMIAKKPIFANDLNCDVGTSLFLYQINNPSNLGAVIRTAEAAGVSRLIVSEGSADAYSPKSLRASMGSAFRVPILEGANAEVEIMNAKEKGIEIVAVDAKGLSIYSQAFVDGPKMLVFGSEAHGLPDEIQSAADAVISIPMNSSVESLNLAVSSGIVIFEVRRRSTI